MRTIAVIALAAVPAALAADNPSPSTQASTLCKQQRTALGTKAFTLLYGGSSNAFGRCVSKVAGIVQNATSNAAKQCAAERAQLGATAFTKKYGGRRNAFGKCVAKAAKATH